MPHYEISNRNNSNKHDNIKLWMQFCKLKIVKLRHFSPSIAIINLILT